MVIISQSEIGKTEKGKNITERNLKMMNMVRKKNRTEKYRN